MPEKSKNTAMVKIHSEVDVITNSSNVTYITTLDSSVNKVKDLLQKILNSVGIKEPVENYFDIHFVANDALEKEAFLDEYFYWGIMFEPLLTDEKSLFFNFTRENYINRITPEMREEFYNYYKNNPKALIKNGSLSESADEEDVVDFWEDLVENYKRRNHVPLMITAKKENTFTIDIIDFFTGLVDFDSERDG